MPVIIVIAVRTLFVLKPSGLFILLEATESEIVTSADAGHPSDRSLHLHSRSRTELTTLVSKFIPVEDSGTMSESVPFGVSTSVKGPVKIARFFVRNFVRLGKLALRSAESRSEGTPDMSEGTTTSLPWHFRLPKLLVRHHTVDEYYVVAKNDGRQVAN